MPPTSPPRGGRPESGAGAVSIAFLLAVLAAFAPAQDAPPPAQLDPGGAQLYRQHCSGCHGVTGDGKGTTELKVQARSFQEGRFAFGDTPEQLLHTITRGIKGRTEMPGFGDTVSEADRKKIVDHVRTLLPKRGEVSAAATRLAIGARAQVVRGILPPIVEKAPQRPRGLLVGVPGGLSLEYRTDDVRLLGARRGEFVDRKDWHERGGSPLEPLGTLVWTAEKGDPAATFSVVVDGQPRPLVARFAGTEVLGAEAALFYRLVDAGGTTVADVEERVSDRQVSTGSGFTRRFTIRSAARVEIQATLDGVPGLGLEPPLPGAAPSTASPPDGSSTCEFFALADALGPGCAGAVVRGEEAWRVSTPRGLEPAFRLAIDASRRGWLSVTVLALREAPAGGVQGLAREVPE